MHPKIIETGLPFEFSIPEPSAEWIIQTEGYIAHELENLEAFLWNQAVSEYRTRELAAMTAKRYIGKLTAMLDGEANG